jgi:site-specific DNA-methyltransferase (adenine-specific)
LNISLEQIRMDGGTQSRAQLDWVAIDEYAGAMASGDVFPPIIAFYDGVDYWLADGFHRVRAAENAGLDTIAADVRQGTRRDAILHSVSANSDHGVRRTNRDKRQAVLMLLNDDEWQEWADAEVAKRCGVSPMTVGRIRAELISNKVIDRPAQRKVKRNGKTYTMNTAAIGEKTEPEPTTEPAPDLFAVAEEPAPEPPPQTEPDEEPIPDYLPWDEVEEPEPVATSSPIVVHNKDARFLADYASDVHLVITSPPYNVGIDYDNHSDSMLSYFDLLQDIWEECHKVMVDGGRICVNVPFGVGRKPWVPLAAHITSLMIEAGFTLRGQIIWDKGTTGNRATWGSFRLPTDPALRDTTECVIVAHKGQSNLEIPAEYRLKDDKGTHTAWLADSDYFMEMAQDHWQIAPESARRVGHPAPFPTELVRRLVHFYGFPGCHLLDPFGGSGTVGVVAKELGCRATLFEISQDYSRLAEERIEHA